MKKWITALLALCLSLSVFACGNKESGGGGGNGGGDEDYTPGTFDYYEEVLSDRPDYNANLFYLNSLEFEVADPSVIYVDEGPEKGYFYAYGTCDEIGCHGFQSWRSKDLTHWESMGIAMKPDFSNTWAASNYWAPEVLYDRDEKLYYLFYNADNYTVDKIQTGWEDGKPKMEYPKYMSVAYSTSPQGPFLSPDGRRDADGNVLRADKPVYDLTAANPAVGRDVVRAQAIDASPFIDPVSGKKYLYFSYFDTFSRSEIFGMEMRDWFTPDYSTIKQLTAEGYLTVEGAENSDITQTTTEGGINEGPFMYYEDGTYYMTLSVFGYTDERYQVRQALSDSPLGTFEKLPVERGGAVIASDPDWDHVTTAGHHSFIKCGDELFVAYHTFYNRYNIDDGRALAIDPVKVADNGFGQKVLYANGPNYSLQPLPEQISGYKNVALSAAVTSDNTADGSDVTYLNDGLLKYRGYDLATEYETAPGKTVISLKWEDYVTARALMVYNSYDYDYSFVRVEKAELFYQGEDGKRRSVSTGMLNFDYDWHADSSTKLMRPGGAAIAEFYDLPVDEIRVTLTGVGDEGLCIPEIVVLGKDEAVAPSAFREYSFVNPAYGSPEMINRSRTFGTVGGLNTGYGYDLTHDDGTPDAYITQNWCYDQYAYFNNVYSTTFYVEAKITVNDPVPYANDDFPKFGIAISSVQNSLFYYVDAVGFTKQMVGVAQRTLDNKDWDWKTTEKLYSVEGLRYTDDNYVTLAVAREGAVFHMYCNGKKILTHSTFNVFTATQKAAVGFLTFNTGIKVKDYSATDDPAAVAAKIAELGE